MLMNTKEINLSELFGAILGLRSQGAKARELLSDNLQNSIPSTINFSNINSISPSFADELIAKNIENFGIQKFKSLVNLANANSDVKAVINFVVKKVKS